MSTLKLIKKLSKENQKVRPTPSTQKRTLVWCIISSICLLLGITANGLSDYLVFAFSSPLFLLETVFIFSTIIASVYVALLLSIPGRFKWSMTIWVMLPFLFWLSLLLYRLLRAPIPFPTLSLSLPLACISNFLIFGLAPGLFLFVMIRMAAPLKFGITGLFASIAAFSLAAIGLQFTCTAVQNPLHVILGHFLPIIVLSLIGIFIGKITLKK